MTNTERVQMLYAAFGRGDISAIMDSLSDDISWTAEGPSGIPYHGTRNGKAEVLEYFTKMGSTEIDPELNMTEFVAEGDKVVGFGRLASTVAASGIRYDTPLAHLFEFRDGKVIRFVTFADTFGIANAHARAAASAAN